MKLKEQVDKLINFFGEGAGILGEYEVNLKSDERWSEELSRLSEKLKCISTTKALAEFIEQNEEGLFGVKDTFIELVISSGNGHVASDFQEANQKLNAYRQHLYEFWKLVKEELEKSGDVT